MELQQEKDHLRLFLTVFRPFSTVLLPPVLIVRKEVFAPYIECLRHENRKIGRERQFVFAEDKIFA